MATRRKAGARGRRLVALGLVGFMVVASFVVWRRSVGVSTAKEMSELNLERRSLETERTTLLRSLETAKSRTRVIAESERRLGLHVASDSQTRVVAPQGATP